MNCQKKNQCSNLSCQKDLLGNFIPANWNIKRRINLANCIVQRKDLAIQFKQTWLSKEESMQQTELSKGSIGQFDSSKLNCQTKDQGQTELSKGRIWQFDLSKLDCQKNNQFGKLSCQKNLLGNLIPANWIVKRIDLENCTSIVWRKDLAIWFQQIELSKEESIWQTVFSKGSICQFDLSKLDCQKKDQFGKLSCYQKDVLGNLIPANWTVKRIDLENCTSIVWRKDLAIDSGKLNCQKEDQFGKVNCQ